MIKHMWKYNNAINKRNKIETNYIELDNGFHPTWATSLGSPRISTHLI